jgi:hypothetical protein
MIHLGDLILTIPFNLQVPQYCAFLSSSNPNAGFLILQIFTAPILAFPCTQKIYFSSFKCPCHARMKSFL